MANEKIKIHNFGGITNLEAEFNQINIFIGPQASGKSITVKLIFFFKNIFSDMLQSVLNEEDKRKFKNKQIDKFNNLFPKGSIGSSPFSVEYDLDDEIGIRIIRKDQEANIKLEFTKGLDKIFINLKNLYQKLKREIRPNDDKPNFIRLYELEKELEKHLYKYFDKKERIFGRQIFIPAGRNFFSILEKNIFSFLVKEQRLDPFLMEFGSTYELFKEFYFKDFKDSAATSAKDKEGSDGLERLIREVLCAYYSREVDGEFLVHDDKRKVRVANASSGQQETLPLLIIFEVLINQGFVFSNSSLYIEEPEAHLFPSAQNTIVKLLARLCNSKNNNFQIFLTTHSPYVLTSFNNLFLAGQIIDKNQKKREQVESYIHSQEILSIHNVSAYALENGSCRTMLDQETGLIDAEILDSISEKINLEFDNLLNVQYGDQDEF